MKQGLLYSQVGYDIGDPMKAYFRSDDAEAMAGGRYEITRLDTGKTESGKVDYWGSKWGTHWWVLDFSGIPDPCRILIRLYGNGVEQECSLPIEVGYNLIWDKTIKKVAIEAFEERQKRARNGLGWKDCGSDFREVCSIATPVIALCDLLNKGSEDFSGEDQERLRKQIIAGAEYLCKCMDAARAFGMPEGAVVHDIPNYMVTIPGDVGKTVIALARAAVILYEKYPAESARYLNRAVKGYEYILHGLRPYGGAGINRALHGIPEGAALPDEFMTRDLLLFMWAGIALCKAGQQRYEGRILEYADQIMARQIPREANEEGIYGHFYIFDSLKISEKTWIHHDIGHDTGGILPEYILPFCELCTLFGSHEKAPRWRELIRKYTTGYFIPACQKNPFNLLPVGYYEGEGWLNFCGPWHGFNATICYTAALAQELSRFVEDRALYEIAVSNLQWICGVNAGITFDSFDSCVFWREDIPEGRAVPYSQIVGVGQRSVYCWTDIIGTIPNGFCVNPQFKFEVENLRANDAPLRYTDEDWIPHSAGFITAMAALNISHFFAQNHPRARKLLDFMESNQKTALRRK